MTLGQYTKPRTRKIFFALFNLSE